MYIGVKPLLLSILLSASTIIYAVPALTYKSNVHNEIDNIQKKYKEKCMGAGWIEVKQVHLSEVQSKIHPHHLHQHKAIYPSDLHNLLEECVMQWKGVSGPLLTRSARATLSDNVGSRLWDLLVKEGLSSELTPFGFWYNPTQSGLFSTGADILNTPCSLVIPVGQGMAFQLDGHSTD
jgi:hypothetical protein